MTPKTKRAGLASVFALAGAVASCAPQQEATYPRSAMIGVVYSETPSAPFAGRGVTSGAWLQTNPDGTVSVQRDTPEKRPNYAGVMEADPRSLVISTNKIGFYSPTVMTLNCDEFNGAALKDRKIGQGLLIQGPTVTEQGVESPLTVNIDGINTEMKNTGLQNCRLTY